MGWLFSVWGLSSPWNMGELPTPGCATRCGLWLSLGSFTAGMNGWRCSWVWVCCRGRLTAPTAWEVIRLAVLAFSFLSLGAFGASLLAPDDRMRRISLVVPLVEVAIWGFGLLLMRDQFSIEGDLWRVADVWTRYVLAIPSALLASAGLIAQQRAFRQAGLAQFSRDSLWAAVAFAWYGVVGQMFTQKSPLFPSTVINQDLFLQVFGFPVQLLRAVSAVVAATFVIRFLRSFEVEVQRQIAALQAARLEEAQRREAAARGTAQTGGHGTGGRTPADRPRAA